MTSQLMTEVHLLGEGLLALYEATLELGQPDVAEHLLRALEALAQSKPECQCIRDKAYLMLGRPNMDG